MVRRRVAVCVCVLEGVVLRGWGSHVFHLTSPETMRQPARFVPKVNKGDSDLWGLKTLPTK